MTIQRHIYLSGTAKALDSGLHQVVRSRIYVTDISQYAD